MTEKLTDALYEETLARIADGHIDCGGTIGLRRWCDGSGPCAVETEPHGHWRGGVGVSTREVVLRLVRERDEARASFTRLLDENLRLREALADIARTFSMSSISG